jgi:hypothetical protein
MILVWFNLIFKHHLPVPGATMFRQHAQQRHRQLNEIDDALADSGTYGICSTFYTNNPLLYASHFAQLDASDLRS